jgi:ankyrin repeat protein
MATKGGDLIDWTSIGQSLMTFTLAGSAKDLRYLLDKYPGLALRVVGPEKGTLLHHAAHLRHLQVVRLLCEREPGLVQCTRSHGATALHDAAGAGALDVRGWVGE